MPKISIIMAVYNAQHYLKRSIESVLNQSFTDFELILVDDGSQDNSLGICNDYCKQDTRITVIHQHNQGTSAARNTGLDNACGTYVTFMDNDDYAKSNWLEVMYRATENETIEIVKGGFFTVEDVPDLAENLSIIETRALTVPIHSPQDFIHFMAEGYGNGLDAMWNQLVKRALFSDIRFPIGSLSEDFYVCFYLCLKSKKIKTIPQTGYCWVQRGASQSHEVSAQRLLQHIKVRSICLDYLWTTGDDASLSLAQQLWQNFRVAFPDLDCNLLASAEFAFAKNHFKSNKKKYYACLKAENKLLFALWNISPVLFKNLLNAYRSRNRR